MRFLYNYKKSFEELSQSLQNYEYKRNDNLVYRCLDPKELENERFIKYENLNFSYYTVRNKFKTLIDEKRIEVSNFGRIRLNGEILQQFQKNYGYLYVRLSDEIDYPVYRLVAETYCKFPNKMVINNEVQICNITDTALDHPAKNYWEVHHIVNNGFNNQASNLMWMIHTDHQLLSHKYVNNKLRIELKNKLINDNIDYETKIEILDDLIAIHNKYDKDFIESEIKNLSKTDINNPYLFWNYKNTW